jgi:hypothetical protein
MDWEMDVRRSFPANERDAEKHGGGLTRTTGSLFGRKARDNIPKNLGFPPELPMNYI